MVDTYVVALRVVGFSVGSLVFWRWVGGSVVVWRWMLTLLVVRWKREGRERGDVTCGRWS